jgi:tetratricopeptide (TPR) repeat protein
MEKGEEFYPEAEKMMLKALAIVQKQSNIQLKENVFSSLCQLYNWMENGEKAIEFAKQNLGVQKDRTTCYKAFELLGSAYYLILQYDSARHYLQKSLFTTDYATKAGAYMYLADIAKEQGDLATSLEMEL